MSQLCCCELSRLLCILWLQGNLRLKVAGAHRSWLISLSPPWLEHKCCHWLLCNARCFQQEMYLLHLWSSWIFAITLWNSDETHSSGRPYLGGVCLCIACLTLFIWVRFSIEIARFIWKIDVLDFICTRLYITEQHTTMKNNYRLFHQFTL